ncbi:hypothetical protein B0T17DRAFT_288133 [Bombardia bombarda]|uniref:Secreted protein n=1 Tax=Bombardia bombarda TaxID=252184 RepID=A0AA39WTM2_9PEZI|nr:hypothetical protein B0T17DRAFT_288133 [Bombardia bombarda]
MCFLHLFFLLWIARLVLFKTNFKAVVYPLPSLATYLGKYPLVLPFVPSLRIAGTKRSFHQYFQYRSRQRSNRRRPDPNLH